MEPTVRRPLLFLIAVLAGAAAGAGEPFSFSRLYVDLDYGGNGRPGWVRAGDMDGDGDLDVVCARYTDDLGWWENPGGELTSTPWSFHVLSFESRYLHDMILADLDRDGVAEEVVANLNQGYWSARITIKWFRPGGDPASYQPLA